MKPLTVEEILNILGEFGHEFYNEKVAQAIYDALPDKEELDVDKIENEIIDYLFDKTDEWKAGNPTYETLVNKVILTIPKNIAFLIHSKFSRPKEKPFTKEEAQKWLNDCWLGDWVEKCDDDNLVMLVNFKRPAFTYQDLGEILGEEWSITDPMQVRFSEYCDGFNKAIRRAKQKYIEKWGSR